MVKLNSDTTLTVAMIVATVAIRTTDHAAPVVYRVVHLVMIHAAAVHTVLYHNGAFGLKVVSHSINLYLSC